MARREAALPSLGIDGLPLASGLMEAGGAYAVTAALPWTLLPLTTGLVARSLLDQRPVTLAAGAATADVLRQLAAHGVDAQTQMASGRLQVLTQSAHAGIKLRQYGPTRLIEELEYFGNPRGRLYVIAPADDYLSGDDRRLASQQSACYARWCAQSRATGVFVLAGDDEASAPRLQALDGWFAGVARLSGDALRLTWDVEHWRSPEGSVGSRQYGIGVAHDGAMLVADGAQTSSDLKIVEAPDYDQVLAVAAAVKQEKSRPAHWQLVGSHEALLTRASGAVASTFVLDCGPDQDIEELAHTVHHLRIHAGNGIKIIVRERGRRLRYHQEMLLGRLGANAVADASLTFSRFLSLIDGLRDRSYDREVPPVFEEAVLAAVPPEEQGYTAAPRFTAAVRDAVARATQLGVQCALVRLTISAKRAHLDVLKQIRASRPGDLYTADDKSVYLFLFACRESDIDTALNRMIGVAQAELFDAQQRFVTPEAIHALLVALDRQLRLSAPVDYSPLLAAPAAAPEAAAVERVSESPPEETAAALPEAREIMVPAARAARSISRAPLPTRH